MAANRDSFLVILCALLLGSGLVRTCEGRLPIPFTLHHVIVENMLRTRSMNVHCWYGKEDLGSHVVRPGDMYRWSFRINLWITTRYTCSVRWSNRRKTFVAYDAREWHYYSSCGGGTCQWAANEYGVSLFNADKGTWDLMFNWEHS